MSTENNDALLERETGLQRQLTRRQLTMIAMGGAIGTGLFLGSGFAVSLADNGHFEISTRDTRHSFPLCQKGAGS